MSDSSFPTRPDGNAYRCMVDPKIARQYLAMSVGNRTIRDSTVKKYAGDMQADKWYTGNDAIIFNEKGELKNGHHRLWAVILSGTTQPFLIRSGVPDHEAVCMDQGLIRNTVDGLRFGDNQTFGRVTLLDTQIAKMVLSPLAVSRFSNETLGEAVLDLRELIDFVVKDCFCGLPRIKSRGLTTPLLAVFVRAAHQPVLWDKLRYAGRYLLDGGDAVERQEVARLPGTSYLKLLFTHLKGHVTTEGTSRRKLFIICMNCLRLFIDGVEKEAPKLSASIKEFTKDQFPIPPKGYMERIPAIYTPRLSLLVALREVAARYSDDVIMTPQQIAHDILHHGEKVESVDPVKTVSAWFGRIAKSNGNRFDLNGVGVFMAETTKKSQKKISRYRFKKANQGTIQPALTA